MSRTVTIKDNKTDYQVQIDCDTQEKSSGNSYFLYAIPLLIIIFIYFYFKNKVSGGIVGTTASLIGQIGQIAPQIRNSLSSKD